MCICFPRRKKNHTSDFFPPAKPTTLLSYTPHAPDAYSPARSTLSQGYASHAPDAYYPAQSTLSQGYASHAPDAFSPAQSTHSQSHASKVTYKPPPPTASLPTARRSYPPTFPLRPTPSCRHCKYTPKYRSTVGDLNQNGNSDRPFYICVKCKNSSTAPPGPKGKGWITWDDNLGIEPGNPKCDCDFVARQDRAGVNSYAPGKGFWSCSTGACKYVSWRADGKTKAQAGEWDDGFVPWQI